MCFSSDVDVVLSLWHMFVLQTLIWHATHHDKRERSSYHITISSFSTTFVTRIGWYSAHDFEIVDFIISPNRQYFPNLYIKSILLQLYQTNVLDFWNFDLQGTRNCGLSSQHVRESFTYFFLKNPTKYYIWSTKYKFLYVRT